MQEKEDKLHEKIKGSFGRMDKKAPPFLWESVSSSLDATEKEHTGGDSQADPLYQKVLDSFATVDGKQAPAHVWQNINKQLNIDLVWTRIENELHGHGSGVSPWKRWVAAASLLFLLSFAAVYYQQKTSSWFAAGRSTEVTEPAQQQTVSAEVPKPENTKASGGHSRKTTTGTGMEGISSNAGIPRGQDADNPNKRTSPSAPTDATPIESPPSVAGPFGNHRGKRTALDKRFPSGAQLLNPLSGDVPDRLEPRHAAIRTSGQLALGDEPGLVKWQLSTLPTAADRSEKDIMQENKRIGFGVTIAYNNSWLLNNETKRSFEKGSLISTRPTFRRAVGLTFNYQAGGGSSLSTELHLSGSGQGYSVFDGGEYLQKELDLTYYKVYVQYQHNFLRHRKSLLSNLTAKAGLYRGHLRERQGELRITESQYSKSDYGVRLAIGQERHLGAATVGYGMSVERGLENIFLGSGSVPSRFNRTYTLSVGPYFNFRLHK